MQIATKYVVVDQAGDPIDMSCFKLNVEYPMQIVSVEFTEWEDQAPIEMTMTLRYLHEQVPNIDAPTIAVPIDPPAPGKLVVTTRSGTKYTLDRDKGTFVREGEPIAGTKHENCCATGQYREDVFVMRDIIVGKCSECGSVFNTSPVVSKEEI